MPARLTLDDLAAIACAPPTATPAELARQLGKPATLIGRQLRRIRQAGGWYSVLRLPPCTVCGETVIGPPKRITHIGCVPARQARWARDKRAENRCPRWIGARGDTDPEVLARRHARTLERQRQRQRQKREGWSDEQHAASLAAVHASDRRGYATTVDHADHYGDLWSEDEDGYLLSHPDLPARDAGLALGRTLWGVRSRRHTLRRRQREEWQDGGASCPSR